MNVIYIVCHDLGRHLGCYGRKVKTPNLDRFASEAIRFDQAFCQTAVCSPSRGACMTGQYAHNNGLMGLSHFGWRIHPETKTVVDHFNEAGYETVHCGLSHEGEENHSRYQTDFEVSWRSTQAENAVDNAVAWLRARQKKGDSQPFYLNIGTAEAHPSIWRKDVDPSGAPSRLHCDYGGPVPPEDINVPAPTPDIPLTRDEFGRFEAGIRFLDQEMGRLFEVIEELKLNEDTMVIFTTDHGMNDWHGKGELYDRGMEIALLARPPQDWNVPANSIGHLIQNIDLTPTLLDAAGQTIPDSLPGKSFLPLLKGKPEAYEPHEHIFLEWNFGGPQDDYSPIRAIRTPRYKLIHNYGPHNYDCYRLDEITEDFTREQMSYKRFKDYGGPYQHPSDRMRPEWELYDLDQDPHELKNLLEADSSAEKSANLRADLAEKLDTWMQATSDHVLQGKIPKIPAKPGFHYM